MSLEDVMAKLSPDLRKKLGTADGLHKPDIAEFNSVGLNRALGGGLRYGRQHLVYGNKAQPVDTVIDTPSGPRRFGDLAVGDYVFGSNGLPTMVVDVIKHGVIDAYRVLLNDGSSTICNGDHLWTVQTRKQQYGSGNSMVMSTEEMFARGPIKHKSHYEFFLPEQPAVVFSDSQDLPMDPYLMGVIIGDGSTVNTCQIAVGFADDPVIPEIIMSKQSDFELSRKAYKNSTAVQYYVRGGRPVMRDTGLWGKKSYDKFIPDMYMRSSIEERIELIRGIMDSDGSINMDAPHRARFTTASEQLADQLVSLVRSVGGYAARRATSVRDGRRDSFTVALTTPFNPFHMPRKAKRYSGSRKWFRAVASIEPMAPAEMMCITVAAEDGLYLTNDYIVTHNSAGKSSMLLELIGNEQRKGKTAAWVDVEQTYDPEWATKLGVDNSNLLVSQARTINEMVDEGKSLMKAGIDIIVVDSISTLLPAVFFEKDSDDLKDLVNTKPMGAEARDMGLAVKMLNYANNRDGETLLILISQTRNNLGAMHASLIPTGGKAVQFYSSTIVRLISSESESQAIKGKINVGDKIIERTVGRKVTWNVTFSKTSAAFQSGEYDFYFVGDHVGIDAVGDLVSTAISLGVIEKGGAWYTVEGQRLQGKDAVIKAVKESDELKAILAGKVSEL